MPKTVLFTLALCLVDSCSAAQPIIDNERVTVWDAAWRKAEPNPIPAHDHDFVTMYLAGATGGTHKKGDVVFAHKGATDLKPGERAVVIELKEHAVPALANRTGYPNAFPRPHVRKVLENDRVIVWSYAWSPGEPTPMHFHDKDVVVVYMEPTALKSTTPDGKTILNEYAAFQTKYNPRDRVHTELLARGSGSAIMTELK